MSSTVISCVVDRQPKFYLQALNWMTSLRPLLDPSTRLEIYHVGPVPDWFSAVADEFGARISQIEPFGSGPAVYCNKLQQLEPLTKLEADTFILSDLDIVFLSSPTKWAVSNNVRAKIVDGPNPPEPMIKALLKRAGFSSETIDCAPDFKLDRRTNRLNCNGGLYVVTKDHLRQLYLPWRKWARFCLAEELLGKASFHADQLGFMLAMIELKLPFDPLPAEANFPVQFGPERYCGRVVGDISALHYHNRIDRNGFLLRTGAAAVDKYIDSANRMLSAPCLAGVRSDEWDMATLSAIPLRANGGIGNAFRVANRGLAAVRSKLGAATWESLKGLRAAERRKMRRNVFHRFLAAGKHSVAAIQNAVSTGSAKLRET